MKLKRLTQFLSFFLSVLGSIPCSAMIPPAQTILILKGNEPIKEASVISNDDAKKLIPTDMPATENQGQVAGRLVDRGVKYVLESDSMKQNSVVQKAQSVGDVMKTNVSLGDPTASGVHHSIDTQADVFQGVEKMHYSGFFSANVVYHNSGNLEMSVDRKLDQNKTLILKHTSSDDVSAIQISWNW